MITLVHDRAHWQGRMRMRIASLLLIPGAHHDHDSCWIRERLRARSGAALRGSGPAKIKAYALMWLCFRSVRLDFGRAAPPERRA